MVQATLEALSGKTSVVCIPDSFDYMVLATVRAGTHWLASRLVSHPELDNFGEIGCQNYPEWMGFRKKTGDLNGFVAHYVDCSTANPDPLFLSYNLAHLYHKPVIHLVRNPADCARSAVANAAVMREMKEAGLDPTDYGQYFSHSNGSEVVQRVEVDPEEVAAEEEDTTLYQALFRDLLLQNNPQHIEVSYEDMKENPEATDLKVLDFLGVEPMKLTSALKPTRRLVTEVPTMEASYNPSEAGRRKM